MRKNVCDLTRGFYADVTEIEDHETCAQQRIGDRLGMVSRGTLPSSPANGREVPGIGPHLFLWTHTVGLSRINAQEAKIACALASYMVECGVPRRSICILTPYKGQLMKLRDTLFKDARASNLKLLSRNNSETDVLRVSTIDRFQGDEEDLIICSLVVDENSKTGFGKLNIRLEHYQDRYSCRILCCSKAGQSDDCFVEPSSIGFVYFGEHWIL